MERARGWLRYAATDFDWYEDVLNFWEQALAQIGFENSDIAFRGFWSQGDGASFSASVDVDRLVEFLANDIEPEDSIDVVGGEAEFRPYLVHLLGCKPTNPKYRRLLLIRDRLQDMAVERVTYRYNHERTCRFTAWLNDRGDYMDTHKSSDQWVWLSNTPRVAALFKDFVEDAENLRLRLCRAIYGMLQEDYQDRIRDEQLLDFG